MPLLISRYYVQMLRRRLGGRRRGTLAGRLGRIELQRQPAATPGGGFLVDGALGRHLVQTLHGLAQLGLGLGEVASAQNCQKALGLLLQDVLAGTIASAAL